MLTSASFQNFKNLRDLKVDLGPFTVLVGPNAAGKTSILQGIHLMTLLGVRQDGEQIHVNSRPGALFSGRWNPRSALTWGARELRIALEELDETTKTPGTALALRCEVPVEEDGDAVSRFTLDVPGELAQPMLLNAGTLNNPLNVLNGPRLRRLARAAMVQLDAARMAAPSLQDEAPRLAADGAGLPAVLSFLASFQPEVLDAIHADTRTVIPGFKRVLTKPQAVTRLVRRPFAVGSQAVDVPVEEKVMAQALFLQMDSGAIVSADMASEGTLLTLGLFALLHGPTAPTLLLIDDLDRALHLGAQIRLVRAIRAIQAQRPELQVVVTTHSPYLLQEVSASDVRVVSAGPDGYARSRALDKHPDYPRLRTLMDTGDLWASLGEDWVGNGG